MLERIRKARRNESGFTLIELLIVIIILGILAAIVVFAVGTTRKDSVQSSCKTDFKSVQLSAEAVMTKSGKYPADSDHLLASANNGALLKSYPTSVDYTLTYAQTGSGTGYTIAIGGSNVVGGKTIADNSATTAADLDAGCAGK